ncbi:hypothetical protein F5B19DRAFT_476941 [Rostrohypoxylon terebratum]|nr:hypothetical protein F5B19DRAFT_476941 [Rostrohypoxylon terebratum]
MNISLVARCAGRVRPSLFSGSQAGCLRLCALPILNQHQISSRTTCIVPLEAQPFSVLSTRQNNVPQSPTPGPPPQGPSQGLPQGQPQGQPQGPPEGPPEGPPPGQGNRYKTWILFNLAGVSAAILLAMVLKSAPPEKNPVINLKTFSPFTITSKEQVSPTAFVITVRPGDSAPDSPEEKKERKPDAIGPYKNAWDYGLWSVEAKQPQLQIARHYTPLPSESDDHRNSDEELRFLVRKIDGGEMSTYLSKLKVGEQMHLRGPHPGFNIEKRLGEAENVVFLAGGTGIAPALQAAKKFLEMPIPEQEKPTVSILWANRRAADALGRQEVPGSKGGVQGWFKGLRSDTSDKKESKEPDPQNEPSLTRQIREMQAKHPSHFRIAYFVDEERSFISAEDIHAAFPPLPPFPSTSPASSSAPPSSSSSSTPPARQPTPLLPPPTSCPWHCNSLLTKLPDADDVGRRKINCTCSRAVTRSYSAAHPGAKPGANLILVSGPDGFVKAYAGAKRWLGKGEMQGQLDGVLKQVLEEREKETEGRERENWMVLKL